jgi:hypothetical protein
MSHETKLNISYSPWYDINNIKCVVVLTGNLLAVLTIVNGTSVVTVTVMSGNDWVTVSVWSGKLLVVVDVISEAVITSIVNEVDALGWNKTHEDEAVSVTMTVDCVKLNVTTSVVE